MKTPVGATKAIWFDPIEIPRFRPLSPQRSLEVDVCVIGAGIAGLTTAYLAASEGYSVVVLDQGPIGDDLLKYVTTRQEMILYEKCDPRGWDVGSGPMESMCGVTTDRIKGRGRRWDLDNAEAMMGLEALYQSSGLWDRYWANAFAHRN